MVKKYFPAIAMVIIALVLYGLAKASTYARTATAYKAKVLCSEVFVAGRLADTVLQADFHDIHAILDQVSARINNTAHTVTTSLYGLGKAKAVYRPGTGCTLKVGPLLPAPTIKAVTEKPWSTAFEKTTHAFPHVNYDALSRTINEAFANNPYNHRALLVAVDGKLVIEHYADGFDHKTPMLSWSAAKSITATLIGIGVQEQYLNVENPIPVREWQGDPQRSRLTWDDLLRMHSGLDFLEDYNTPTSDVNTMLFNANSAAAVAAKSPAAHAPGAVWYYSSGTSNILARTIGERFAENGQNFHDTIYEKFLKPLGLAHTIFETDAAGDFVGSSYLYASGRDWLKMGQLYLQDGVWEGKRILPDGWNDYVAQVTPASDGQYGAHFWLNREGKSAAESNKKRQRYFPGLPEDVYFFAGRDGQYIVIIPDKEMVIVRLGITRDYPVIPKMAPLFKKIYDSVQ